MRYGHCIYLLTFRPVSDALEQLGFTFFFNQMHFWEASTCVEALGHASIWQQNLVTFCGKWDKTGKKKEKTKKYVSLACHKTEGKS